MRRKMAVVSGALLAGLLAQLGLSGCAGHGAGGDMGSAAMGMESNREALLVKQYGTLSEKILQERKASGDTSETSKKEELDLVRGLLNIYREQANAALTVAKTATGSAQKDALKNGIEAITKLAQEGDKTVDGIKLKLREGGHHHNKEDGVAEEYIFIDSQARKALMEDAGKLRKLVAGDMAAPATEVAGIQEDVNRIADEAMKE